MTLYTRQIDNYIGGVSQQAYNLRYANQFNEQINCISSVVNGLIKRPPTELIYSKIFDSELSVATHKYSRGTGADENFLMNIIREGNSTTLLTTDLNGLEYTTEDPLNVLGSYIGNLTDMSKLKFISIEDTTFLVNTQKVVEKDIAKSPAKPLQVLVYVKQTDYGKTFKINIEGTEVSYTTPDGSDASHSTQTGTDYVAQQLSTQLTAAGKTNYITGGNVIVINTQSVASILETSDGLGGRGLFGINETIGRFEDLPQQAPAGFVVKVINTDSIDADDYYVEFVPDSGAANGIGIWKECVAPNIDVALDSSTMPISLVFDKDNQRVIVQWTTYDNRKSGDDETNPFPSFLGSTINDIFVFQDRLGYITDTFCTLSESSNYFNFFRNSVIVYGDKDVIDVGVNSYDSYKLHAAVPWNEVLVLFSKDKQFILRSTSSSLTFKSVAINQSSSYKSNSGVRPKEAGSMLLFSSNNGENTNVHEMFMLDYNNTDARNTTQHVSNYIPKNINALEVLDSYNMAVMKSSEDKNVIYVYQYLFNGNEKVQNCYHKWNFDFNKIHAYKFIDNDLYIQATINNKFCTLKMEINDIQKDEGLEYKVHLDKRVSEKDCFITYDSETDMTRVEMPLSYENPLIVIRQLNGLPSGYVLEYDELFGNVMYLKGDRRIEKFYVGEKYEQYLEHSTMTSVNPYTNKIDIGGVVKILSHTLTYSNTGYFKACVKRRTGSDRNFTFKSKTLNDYESDFEEFKVKTGAFKYTIKGENTECTLCIINDSHLPCNIQSSVYDYRFYKQSR